MSFRSRLPVATVTYCIVYAALYLLRVPMLIYYPRAQMFHLGAPDPSAPAPAMLWFGWVLSSALVAIIVVPLVPKRWTDRLWNLTWLAPSLLLIGIIVHERHWFMQQ